MKITIIIVVLALFIFAFNLGADEMPVQIETFTKASLFSLRDNILYVVKRFETFRPFY